MESYIIKCIAGIIAINEDLAIENYKLFKEDEVISNLIKIEDKEVISEEIELIDEISDKYDKIIIETTNRLSSYKEVKDYEKLITKSPNKCGDYLRENLEEILLEIKFAETKEDLKEKIIDINRKLTTAKVKKSSEEDDRLLIQAINSVDDIDESISKLVERMRDWYTVYFPEMDTIGNNETYIKLIAENDNRESILNNHPESFQDNIEESFGGDVSPEDLQMMKDFANSIYSLQNSRKQLEQYIEDKMESIAPNLKDLLGASLGAKLIAHIGSVKKLATYSASTVQIMGAEKAIFRHLKTGERPPKHGLIFQHPSVRTAKWWNRGKIARNLALKITLAVRKDVYSGEYDPQIAIDYENKIKQIEKDNPFPKKTSKRLNEEKKERKGKNKGKSKKYKGNKKNKKNKKKRRK
ncbi:MAG: ATP-binding protein [archaeon]|nr:ATP-binding protein [archaeon]